MISALSRPCNLLKRKKSVKTLIKPNDLCKSRNPGKSKKCLDMLIKAVDPDIKNIKSVSNIRRYTSNIKTSSKLKGNHHLW